MNLRSAIFWGRDLLSGGSLRDELRDVEFLNSRIPEATTRRLELLQEQLDYVTSKVPYYRDRSGFGTLEDFPVLGKEEIRAKKSEMLAEGIDTSKVHVASTSGSTGTPFRIHHCPRKRKRINAEAIYFGKMAGYQVGYPLWHLKVWTKRNAYSRLGAFARNLRSVDVSTFSKDDVRALFDRICNENGNSSIIAYSSSLETIARTFQDEISFSKNQKKVHSIVGQSEPLSQEARKILRQALGIYPVGRYGLEETGILAQQQRTESATYSLNLASHLIEVLGMDDDERVAEGDLGRVVVTDLFNKAQPIIRYDTGDLAVAGSLEPGTGFVDSFVRLDGRSRERLYDVDDKPLAPMIAYNFWWKFPEIVQYQIVQRGRGDYILRIDVTTGFDRESELIEEFMNQVGYSARIEVQYGSSDYRHASGKQRAIVSEYFPTSLS